jgi:hypothetical protein
MDHIAPTNFRIHSFLLPSVLQHRSLCSSPNSDTSLLLVGSDNCQSGSGSPSRHLPRPVAQSSASSTFQCTPPLPARPELTSCPTKAGNLFHHARLTGHQCARDFQAHAPRPERQGQAQGALPLRLLPWVRDIHTQVSWIYVVIIQ